MEGADSKEEQEGKSDREYDNGNKEESGEG